MQHHTERRVPVPFSWNGDVKAVVILAVFGSFLSRWIFPLVGRVIGISPLGARTVRIAFDGPAVDRVGRRVKAIQGGGPIRRHREITTPKEQTEPSDSGAGYGAMKTAWSAA